MSYTVRILANAQRDLADIEAYYDEHVPLETERCFDAIEVAGVTVVDGDYVYVDAAGGVVIPAVSIEAVLVEAETIVKDDEGFQGEIESGEKI